MSLVTLKHHPASTYDVDVYLGSDISATTTLTPDATTHVISIHGQHSGLVLKDLVVAAAKDPSGWIFFDNSSSGTLEVDAGEDDTLMQVTASTATSATIEVTDGGSNVGVDKFGTGVTYLTLRTSDAHTGITDFYPNGGTAVRVATNNTAALPALPTLSPSTHLTVNTGAGTYDTIDLGGTGNGEAVVGAVVITGAGNDVVTLADDGDDGTTASIDFGAGDPSGNHLGLGNALNVHQLSVATLEQHAGSGHTVVVDHVHLFQGGVGGGTLIVANDSTIGDMQIDTGGVASVEAALTVASSGSTSGIVTIDAAGTIAFTGDSAGSMVDTVVLAGIPVPSGDGPALVYTYAGSSTEITNLNVAQGRLGTINAADESILLADSVHDAGHLIVNLTSDADVSVGTFLLADQVGILDVNDGGTLTVTEFDISDSLAGDGSSVNVNDGASVVVVNASTIAQLNVEGIRASLLFQSGFSHVRDLTIRDDGKVTLQQRNEATTAAQPLIVNTLLMDAPATGKLDLKNNALIIDYSSSSPIGSWNGSSYTGTAGLLQSGYNGGGWAGDGIVTTMTLATTSSYTSIGIAEASQVKGISGTETALFAGEAVDATTVLIKYTYGGDANLDGKINVDDYGRIDFNVGLGTNMWFNGDFNNDGKIDVNDYGILDFNVGIQGSPL